MRHAFVRALQELMAKDDRIMLLTGDLGYNMLEPIRDGFPKQYINVGIMEQTMMGIAAGLALEGAIPFVYSISTFNTLRCLEQIRNDVIHHNLPVKIVMYGAENAYASLGHSHACGDEFIVMRCLGLDIATPCSAEDAYACTKEFAYSGKPAYLRLGKT